MKPITIYHIYLSLYPSVHIHLSIHASIRLYLSMSPSICLVRRLLHSKCCIEKRQEGQLIVRLLSQFWFLLLSAIRIKQSNSLLKPLCILLLVGPYPGRNGV